MSSRELGAHTKFWNPTTTPSGKISNEPEERAAHALRSDQLILFAGALLKIITQDPFSELCSQRLPCHKRTLSPQHVDLPIHYNLLFDLNSNFI